MNFSVFSFGGSPISVIGLKDIYMVSFYLFLTLTPKTQVTIFYLGKVTLLGFPSTTFLFQLIIFLRDFATAPVLVENYIALLFSFHCISIVSSGQSGFLIILWDGAKTKPILSKSVNRKSR
eukprot:TRINITY_DN23034_c0_g1_i2.p1 TRINITY_DN23034_c0_g1~~TRINITY_DN23034_c0_g1_i2.p1  ORF type:complete len:121 (-),score=8.96 TRINITY_DN23034_c0_g1_i2:148-510(-)